MSDDTISIVRPADSTDSTLAFPVHTTNPGSEGTRSAPTAGPVFVDASGRRRRRVRRLGLILMVLAAGYLTLVVSTALGGPTVDAPFLPLPAPPDATARHASGHVPSVKHRTAPGSGGTTGSGTRPDSTVSTARSGSAASSASASPSSASSASASASPTGSASAGPSASASPGQTTAAPNANGKSHASSAPGASHRPVKS